MNSKLDLNLRFNFKRFSHCEMECLIMLSES